MTTTIYDIEELGYGVEGWNGILESFIQKFETYVFTRFLVTVGESVVKGNPLYLDPTGKRWNKAQADGVQQPARCLALESGDAGDTIRAQHMGAITLSQLFQIGRSIWLSPTTAGVMTQDDQSGDPNGQCLGWGHVIDGQGESGTHTMFIDIQDMCNVGPTYTTTTSTTSTTV